MNETTKTGDTATDGELYDERGRWLGWVVDGEVKSISGIVGSEEVLRRYEAAK